MNSVIFFAKNADCVNEMRILFENGYKHENETFMRLKNC